ncbi:molybdopterin cofactor-binding domain-containing protein [Chitinophaga sp. LS1]|uniref:molybdopterin cofactor-binding domain-containing protein n=1 Tax=Chitinophaga sp. LS1 TaxID=3051176 RepID=UPI002AAAE9E4|nr:molybdopterin cofactor-binding domain-containing protein [Chitinophaga sp. LS1]WPV66971.1 molybdopterin-dependent oxidoreductase [Chitinophaga sp. LS1]
MKNIDSDTHVTGTSVYLDDLPLLQGTLFAAAYGSPVAHGILRRLEIAEALQIPGVVRIFTASDIPGENQIGGIIQDEPLFADHHIHFAGMPLALVVAKSRDAARAAVKKIQAIIDPLEVITNPRVAQAKGELIMPPKSVIQGDTNSAWSQCTHIFEGAIDINGQEHLYIETQGAYAIPQEHGSLKVYSSTQGPTAVQRTITRVLGIPMHRLEVVVSRLGGGFGGKEDQANTWAALCALAAHLLNKPVKYSLHRMEDMAMTGKRHPYMADFKIGLDSRLKILAYEVTFFQNAGASADLSPAVLQRTLFHCTNAYYIPNVTATAYSCKTHLPPNTAFRGFGGPQGMYVIEAAIAAAAAGLQIDKALIQRANLIQTGDPFPYGQLAESEAIACWDKAVALYELENVRAAINTFNEAHLLVKKGIALMPICFGISFTNTLMNNARSLVHIYSDGSVGISTGAVEMGQGVNTKILQVAAQTLGIAYERVKINVTSTYTIANTSPSAASATADLNGKATWIACNALLERLLALAAADLKVTPGQLTIQNEIVLLNGTPTEWNWLRLVNTAFVQRVSLSEHGHYATPTIHYNNETGKGHPFAYHVYGTAIIEVTIDCLRGTYETDSVKVVHDFGLSMNPDIDRGQIEGGIVQGIGWMTLEEVIYNQHGKLVSNALSTYKVPDIYAVPKDILIDHLHTDNDNLAIFRSKAVGEPPLMYGIGAWFALRDAILAFHPKALIPFVAPMTPEKVLMALYSKQPVPAHEEKVSHLGIDQ